MSFSLREDLQVPHLQDACDGEKIHTLSCRVADQSPLEPKILIEGHCFASVLNNFHRRRNAVPIIEKNRPKELTSNLVLTCSQNAISL